MFKTFHPATRAAAAALLSSSLVFLPALAIAQTAAPASAMAPSPKVEAAKAEKHSEQLEAHIADLHQKLNITPAQSTQWDAFAQVMRDNGLAMEDALQARDASKGISAVADMESYAKIAQAHADGMQKVVPAFKTLYESLTPDQQKNADHIFEDTRHGMTGDAMKKS